MESLLEKGKKHYWIYLIGGVLLTLLIGFLDYISGKELSFEVFYLLPVGLITLYLGRWQGFSIAVLGALCVLANDLSLKPSNLNVVVAWNFVENLLTYSAFTVVLTFLNIQLEKQNTLVREDSLTGVGNRKLFIELAELEMSRLKRYKRPFTAALVKVMNLGEVNQQLGQDEGDFLLVFVAKTIKSTVRVSDIAARLSSNEFAILFPETGSEASMPLVEKIKKMLGDISENQKNSYEIVFNAACVTFLGPPKSVNDIFVCLADVLDEAVRLGTNAVGYGTFQDEKKDLR